LGTTKTFQPSAQALFSVALKRRMLSSSSSSSL